MLDFLGGLLLIMLAFRLMRITQEAVEFGITYQQMLRLDTHKVAALTLGLMQPLAQQEQQSPLPKQ